MQDYETIFFGDADEQIRAMAVFIAQLVREGVRFEVTQQTSGYKVWLTGGY